MSNRNRPEAVRNAKRRGSTMVLVVVMLVIAAILGTAYIQVARLDRLSSAQLTSNNIDIVCNSVINYIETILKDDVLNSTNGEFFDAGREPYDYDWTNPNASYLVIDSQGTALGSADGGINDDTWLASSYIDDTATDPVWPHITDMSGVFLDILSDQLTPVEYPVDNAVTHQRNDTAVKITGTTSLETVTSGDWPLGADADNDGILDSRWTWAPIRQIQATRYVMALRIVDNSSFLNANVALSLSSGGTVPSSPADNPRWWNPTALDLGGYAFNFDDGVATTANELVALLSYRMFNNTTTATVPSPWDTNVIGTLDAGDRWHYWLAGPTLYEQFDAASNYVSLTREDEIKLRLRNGLVDPSLPSQIESLMPGVLRTLITDKEQNIQDFFTNRSIGLPPAAADQIKEYYYGDDSAPEENGNARIALTVHSGATVAAIRLEDLTVWPTHNGTGLTADPVFVPRKDVNVMLATADPDTLSREIRKVFERTAGSEFSTPAHITGATAADKREKYANLIAIHAIDAFDADNVLTKFPINSTVSTGDLFGHEALPFLTQIYVQRPYIGQSISDAAVSGEFNVSSASATATQVPGYMIEIRNPYQIPVALANVYLYVDGVQFGALNTIAGGTVTPINGSSVLLPRQTLVLSQDSSGGRAGTESDVELLMEDYAVWSTTPPTYTLGDIVLNTAELYVALRTHTPVAGNEPGTAGGTPYWRRERIKVPVGTLWPTNASGAVTVELRASYWDGTSVTQMPTGYVTLTSKKWLAAETITGPGNVVFLETEWAADAGGSFSNSDIVRNDGSPDALAYRCILGHGPPIDATNQPPNATYWTLDDPSNTYYQQHAVMGNTQGINQTLATSTMLPTVTVETFSNVRTDPHSIELDRVGKNRLDDDAWDSGTVGYVLDDRVTHSGLTYICIQAHTSSGATTPGTAGGAAYWRQTYPGGSAVAMDPSANQWYLTNDVNSGMNHIGDLANLTVWEWAASAANTVPTLAASWPTITSSSSLVIPTTQLMDTAGNLSVPHLAVIMNRLTTSSPLEDGFDNNYDGTADDGGELFVPGTINVNTVAYNVLVNALPIGPDNTEAARDTAAVNIITYRSDASAGNRGGIRDDLEGIATMGELIEELKTVLTTGGYAGDSSEVNTVVSDYTGAEDASGDMTPDGIADDREEETAIAKWLMEVGTTRSDIFTAYVVIRGYEAADFRKGPVEFKRFIVVFDRSEVQTGTDRVKVWAFQQY